MAGFESLAVFGTSFLVGLSGALAPGPLLALDIRESTARGFWAGPYIATGHSLLELLVVVLLAVGLLRFIEGGVAFSVIAICGAIFPLWIGWGMVRQRSRALPTANGGLRRSGH